ncbi:nitronate monooxygenase [Arenibacterium sp. LLYu02]|uniref:nitronate monooxygenase n=1 Tax=Arenibacterium sp. LLYu02 TaxID=3404132 RepID=UPI003B2134A2
MVPRRSRHSSLRRKGPGAQSCGGAAGLSETASHGGYHMNADLGSLRTPLCDLLGCEYPVVLAGMGGVARSELAAAVANAGGFPTLGMVREAPSLIISEIEAYRGCRTTPSPSTSSRQPRSPTCCSSRSKLALRWRWRSFRSFGTSCPRPFPG